MENFDIYRKIAKRSGGEIYLGVVGPVRTGKSTFIRKFMELLVLPAIEDEFKKERAIDSMPQPADGKTIMTTEPKFVPQDGVEINFSEGAKAKVKLIDCVGFPVEGALGAFEDGKPRMVKTPWTGGEMKFTDAATIGTEKVISEHSTVAVLVTTDGSFTGIDRENYRESEEKVVAKLRASGKPFVIIYNTNVPESDDTLRKISDISERYGAKVKALDVEKATEGELLDVVNMMLLEFPISTVSVDMPKWMQVLPATNSLISEIIEGVKSVGRRCKKIGEYSEFEKICDGSLHFDSVSSSCDMSNGKVFVTVEPKADEFYKTLSSECGVALEDDYKLLSYVRKMKIAGDEYVKVKEALDDAYNTGYGIVAPSMDEMVLEEPQMVKQGGRYGVKLRASAPSLHIMKVDVETEVSPVLGSESRGEEMVKYLMSEFEVNPQNIWNTDMFGKSLSMVVKEGLNSKLCSVPDEVRGKLRKTLKKIVNEGRGGVICILL
ncbi:MAG: stage IV sporulation protein A [Clostridia bacterium]|nr:stage IV sporulation protein A [Clostridia bacterium]